jgi:hypothetical protein
MQVSLTLFGPSDFRHGARVTFHDRHGIKRTGKVNGLLIFPDHLVLDMGGMYGTPCVVRYAQVHSVSIRRV